jgi:hypothetical protein
MLEPAQGRKARRICANPHGTRSLAASARRTQRHCDSNGEILVGKASLALVMTPAKKRDWRDRRPYGS